MNIHNIPALKGDRINVIIETPLGSCFKYAYDPFADVMRVKHQLPHGYYFAFNFGFIPNTRAGDGDPLDVVLYSPEPCVSGTLIECRIVGALVVRQKQGRKIIRNDRIIAVPAGIKNYNQIRDIGDIDKHLLTQLKNFFVSYENYRGIAFNPTKWISYKQTLANIKQSLGE
jgi:inorganic pyrophosphatase